ncbi:flagellar biosynthesis anti-sigma factor FlgM [Calycomorphotria hydatis]|uniref:Anti-sigma-28 factor FlgM C-terminal domain-containing protein n=1 Tax=Calycomorphotria hydatis TaxID=2528027 RepID=A0A517TC42_9PLAN|nr:flagellar biosynthesis anti-sigma factor FlgM [Calycomorphotria hydatis]QDT65933.1 hypothetical protein V22_31960 [Calycomorphotria hydatis]
MEVNGAGYVPSHQAVRGTNAKPATETQPTKSAAISSPQDQLDISSIAQELADVKSMDHDLRTQRLADIKAAIDDGTYENSVKLDAAVDRLLDELVKDQSTQNRG